MLYNLVARYDGTSERITTSGSWQYCDGSLGRHRRLWRRFGRGVRYQLGDDYEPGEHTIRFQVGTGTHRATMVHAHATVTTE